MTFLRDDEHSALILNLLRTRGERGATRDELKLLMNEAEAARAAWLGFQAAICGKAAVDVRDGEVLWMLTAGDVA